MKFNPATIVISVVLATAFASTARAENKASHPEMWMFDDKPITATSPAKGKDVLKITGHIYARVFFDRSIQEVYGLTPEKRTLTVYETLTDDKTGSANDSVEFEVSKRDFANKWVDLDIAPDPAHMHNQFGKYNKVGFYGPWIGKEDRPFKGTGRHKVYFSITGKNSLKDQDRRATFITFDFTGISVEGLKADAQKAMAASRAAADKDAAVASKSVGLPAKGQLHTAALAAKTEKALKLGNKDLVAVKVIVTGDSWNLVRNRISGLILRRAGEASVVFKDKSGKCILVTNSAVTQEYVGGKFIADGGWTDKGSQEGLIDCANVFK